jgi:hypothetical protein
MTTERQAAANRRNARRSTGPRSGAGKKRASRNSYYHGLTATMATSAERAERVEKLARKIAGDSKGTVILEWARTAARADFDLAQVWWLKIALIERVFCLANWSDQSSLNRCAKSRRFLMRSTGAN